MIQSMTAFASRTGTQAGIGWVWEMRSVNARGLDQRLRLPEGIDGLEARVRAGISGVFKRGNISVSLRMTQDSAQSELQIDEAQLDRVLMALDVIQERAFAKGVTLGQPTAADVLGQRGVLHHGAQSGPEPALIEALKADFALLLADLVQMRAAEGAALYDVVLGQITEIGRLVDQAATAAEARRPETQAALEAAMQRVLGDIDIDPDRLAQELAVLAVKTDVTEEIDRLRAHVAAAHELLDAAHKGDQPLGRKLDFLSQEFNREANTLCAKSQHPRLTAIGLDLKTVIDQMREQIQNVE